MAYRIEGFALVNGDYSAIYSMEFAVINSLYNIY
jgi:hypothetical protein